MKRYHVYSYHSCVCCKSFNGLGEHVTDDGKYVLYSDVKALEKEAERLQGELAEWHKLKDPAALHVNLLRGMPSQLSRELFLHLGGNDTLIEENARLQGEITDLKRKLDTTTS